MFSLKNKKQNRVVFALALFFFASGAFFLTPSPVYAGVGDFLGDLFGSTVGSAFKGLLYGIFVMFGWLASVAITIFGWAIDPNYMSGPSGLLNRSSIYTSWKLIRDFFNLFFILTLLYTAFTIVFQVAKDYKKTLLSLVLAALFVNFSFPITRLIIDITNVPMYYFVNQMGTTGDGKSSLGTVLSASQLEKILIPDRVVDTGVSQLLMAIVFLFIFSITLLVLAVLFVIRLAALIMLLIFSSVGFAASVIPGMQQYGTKWWENLWKYALFGPSATLMLLIATKFFAEISKDNTTATFVAVATKNATPETVSFISAMAMFTIPIIMLWMTIAMAASSSLIGASAVAGKGQQFLKWAGKKATYNNPLGRGLYGGVKKAGMEGNILGASYGKIPRIGKYLTGDYWAKPSWVEANIKGVIGGGMSGARSESAKIHQQEVNKKIKENKENGVNRSVLLGNLESSDAATRQAAALTLAENGEIRSSEDLTQALTALRSEFEADGKTPKYDEAAADMVARVIDKAKDGATSNIGAETYATLVDNPGFYVKNKNKKVVRKDKNGRTLGDNEPGGTPVVGAALEALNSKLKKDGQIKVRVDYEIARKMKGETAVGPLTPQKEREARAEVYDDLIGKMSAEDLAKQKGILKDPGFREYAKNMDAGRLQKVMDKASEKSNAEIQASWSEIIDEVRKEKKKNTAQVKDEELKFPEVPQV